tara:strand:- start:11372 stop:11599 length:228 start_codon:yes stop_codon:yes gene_type:complete
LLNSFVENLSVAGIGGAEDPELTAHWDKCEAAGLPSRLEMAKDGIFRMTRIPLSVAPCLVRLRSTADWTTRGLKT